MIYLSTAVIIQKMFYRNRTLACGITLIGVSLGNMAGPIITEYLVVQYGLRGAILIISALLSNMVPASLMFPRFTIEQRNSQYLTHTQDEVDIGRFTKTTNTSETCFYKRCNFSLMKNPSFVLFCLSFMCFSFNYNSFFDHLIGRAITYKVSQSKAAYLSSSIAVGGLISRITCSFVGNLKCSNCLVIYLIGSFIGAFSSFALTITTEFIEMLMCTIIHGVHLGQYLCFVFLILSLRIF